MSPSWEREEMYHLNIHAQLLIYDTEFIEQYFSHVMVLSVLFQPPALNPHMFLDG